MSINNNIKKLVKIYFEDNQSKFADALGVTRQAAGQMLKEGGSVGLGVVNKIVDIIPDVNLNWLIKDKGDILIQQNQTMGYYNVQEPNLFYESEINAYTQALEKTLESMREDLKHCEERNKEKDKQIDELLNLIKIVNKKI